MLKLKLLACAVGVATLSVQPAHSIDRNCSTASYYGYGDGYNNGITASGERLKANGNTTAHRNLPFGTRLLVTNPSNGKSTIVRVNDRGPYVAGRSLDLSYGAFIKLAPASQGITKVCYTIIK